MKKKSSSVLKEDNETMINSPPSPTLPVNGDVTPRDLGKLCYSLGDIEGNTIEILSLLLISDRTVTEIANHLNLSDSATSQRLSKLKIHGFVNSRRENTKRIYSIIPGTVERIVQAVNQVFGRSL